MPRVQSKKPWCWLDTETTGLEPNGEFGSRVLQVAVKLTDDNLRPWTRGGRTSYVASIKLSPHVLACASTKALEVNKFARPVKFTEAIGLRACERLGGHEVLKDIMPGDEITDMEALQALAVSEYMRRRNRALEKYGDSSKVKPITEVWVMNDYEAWNAAPSPQEVWEIVHSMLSGCHLVCQNIPFDKPHVQNELRLLNLTYPADFRGIEIMSLSNLASQMLGLGVWGLGPVYDGLASKFNLPALDAHEAMADVHRMQAVYKFVRATFLHGVKNLPNGEVQEVPVEVV